MKKLLIAALSVVGLSATVFMVVNYFDTKLDPEVQNLLSKTIEPGTAQDLETSNKLIALKETYQRQREVWGTAKEPGVCVYQYCVVSEFKQGATDYLTYLKNFDGALNEYKNILMGSRYCVGGAGPMWEKQRTGFLSLFQVSKIYLLELNRAVAEGRVQDAIDGYHQMFKFFKSTLMSNNLTLFELIVVTTSLDMIREHVHGRIKAGELSSTTTSLKDTLSPMSLDFELLASSTQLLELKIYHETIKTFPTTMFAQDLEADRGLFPFLPNSLEVYLIHVNRTMNSIYKFQRGYENEACVRTDVECPDRSPNWDPTPKWTDYLINPMGNLIRAIIFSSGASRLKKLFGKVQSLNSDLR